MSKTTFLVTLASTDLHDAVVGREHQRLQARVDAGPNHREPRWQRRELREEVFLHPAVGLEVATFEPGKAMVLEAWGAFVVEPVDENRTRVILRSRVR